ncbi:hypothetical protein BC833DRAFT_102078 [Globomyces pollinis-pini]|nr:hypothetical protein BC833DRAFT_102078 [Globomyces pollinis-pini]
MNSFITQQNLTITRLTLKIIFPLTIILSTMLLIHEIRLLPINKRIYDRLIFTLVLLSLLHTSIPTYYIYSNYKDLQNPNAYRLSLITTSWPAFMSMFVFRLSNMEMLRLLYVLTPFFTPSRITKIQIVESIFGIILSGGMSVKYLS